MRVILPFMALALLAGCADQPQPSAPSPLPPVVAAPPGGAVPALQAEVVPTPPVSDRPLLWQPGHWDRLDGDYIWIKGRWIARGDRGTQWQPGYWSLEGGQWAWNPAHWVQ